MRDVNDEVQILSKAVLQKKKKGREYDLATKSLCFIPSY